LIQGNQLFQIAGLFSLANGLHVDNRFFLPNGQHQWPYQCAFGNLLQIETDLTKQKVPKDQSMSPHASYRDVKVEDGDTFEGYFQRADFILPENLRYIFQWSLPFETMISNLCHTKGRAPVTCAIHFRFGDYRTLRGGSCVLPLDYYRQALALFFQDVDPKEVEFWLFSDEPEMAQQCARELKLKTEQTVVVEHIIKNNPLSKNYRKLTGILLQHIITIVQPLS
jgi:hypothetical protein